MYRHNGIMLCKIDEVEHDGIDLFLIELLMITKQYFPHQKYIEIQNINEKEEYLRNIIKEQVRRLETIRIEHSWSSNPERMGR